MKLIQLKPKDLKSIRLTLLTKQKFKCKVCGCELSLDTPEESKNCHVDHQHFGDKLVRGVLCRRCNSCEGRLWNSYIRNTLKTQRCTEDYEKMLKGLLKYSRLKPTKYIHPKALKKRRRRK